MKLTLTLSHLPLTLTLSHLPLTLTLSHHHTYLNSNPHTYLNSLLPSHLTELPPTLSKGLTQYLSLDPKAFFYKETYRGHFVLITTYRARL